MPNKRIIICSDGTGNTAVKGRGTNVFKLFEAVDLNGHRVNPDLTPQVAIYDDGVGTESFKPLKIFAGATGFGLARNVRHLYKGLVRLYDPGDEIFLFGFSRGAFTVRTLAGLILNCGILDMSKLATASALNDAVSRAYKVYRKRYQTALAKKLHLEPDKALIENFKRDHALDCAVRIKFIGVWDTVDAVGTPFHISDVVNATIHRFKFPDPKLNPSVDHACQALSIDDERQTFHPVLWENNDRIEQVWFAGAHSNVGGGYPKQGMSLVALDWMLQRAEEKTGLRIIPSDRALFHEHANVDDKLYDPRAGLGVFYRWLPRDMAAMCEAQGVTPAIHLSVLERIAHGTDGYAAGNLAPDAEVVITSTGDPREDASLLERKQRVQEVLHSAHARKEPLLARVKLAVFIGHLSYYVYLLSCTAVVLAASVPEGGGSRLNPLVVLKNTGLLIWNGVTGQFGAILDSAKRLLTDPALVGSLVSGFLLAYLLALFTDTRMSKVFSGFWHNEQTRLRDALKSARKASAAKSSLS